MTTTKLGATDATRQYMQQRNGPLAASALLHAGQLDGAAREHLAHQLEKHIDAGTLDPAFGVVMERIGEPALLGGRFDALSRAVDKLDKAVFSWDEAKSESYQMGRNGRLSPDVEAHNVKLFGAAVEEVKTQLAPLQADAAAGKLTPEEKTFVDATAYIVDFKVRSGPPELSWGLKGRSAS